MKITFLGATGTVTGSKYLLDTGNTKILIDCGLFQGFKELRLRNWASLPISPKEIDAVILTHAHIDHSGYLPLLIRNGFTGPVYCSKATQSLCEILLPDSGYLHEEEARFAVKRGYSKHHPPLPLYTMGDAEYALKYFKPIEYNQDYQINSEINFQLTDVGHILGAAFVTVRTQNKSIVFSGDIGRFDDPVMKDPSTPKKADYLVVESTYGDRSHEKKNVTDQLTNVINSTISRDGVIVIPSFAVGRTQLLLYYLHALKRDRNIPDIPIYVDSPMAINASNIFCDYFAEHKLTEEETKAVCDVAYYVNTREQSKLLDEKVFPKIIISASGMATGGRILHHLKKFLPDERNTILFTGYQADGTRGDRLLKGEKQIKMFGELIPVKARISVLDNLSAHSDYNGILTWLKDIQTKPKSIFITHGNIEASKSMKEKIEKKYGWQCILPKYMQTFELSKRKQECGSFT